MHPQLFEMIEYVVKSNVGKVGLTTNGSMINSSNARKLAESGLFMVDISLDAFKKETYNVVRKGLNFEKTIKNVHSILEWRNQINSSLKIMVSFVKQESNLDELEDFENYWEPLVDKVLIRDIHSALNLIDAYEYKIDHETHRWACPHWFRRMVINAEGMLKPCPGDWENKTVYKSLSETTIYDAWHSDFFWENRIEHLNLLFSNDSPCKDCKDWELIPWDLGYEKVIDGLN